MRLEHSVFRRLAKACLLLAALIAQPASANDPATRLDRIREHATIVISHGETAIPFSYRMNSGSPPVGFGIDLSRRIADHIKDHLGLKELRIRWNPVTLATRFPMIVSNTVDLECVTTTNTKARDAMVDFSTTFFISDEGIATRKDSGIRDYPDLEGKRVAVVRGTPTERNLQARFAAAGKTTTIIGERNNRRAIALLASGQADAYIAAVPIIAGELVRLGDSKPFHIVGSGGYKEAFGCMLPNNDTAFKKVVDEAIAKLMASGEMEQIYNRWFNAPVPPMGANIGLPLNEDNRQLYAAPNDRPFE